MKKFIIGVDLGNSRAAVAYYDINTKKPTVFDVSGGYSKASVPVAVEYIPENDEWIFGEYAVLNRPVGGEVIFEDIIENMGEGKLYQIGSKTVSLCYVLSLFLKELIGSVKNINPKAQICAVYVSAPPYMTQKAKDEIKKAFFMAGYENSFMGFADERECVISQYFESEHRQNRLLLLDYGERSIRGNLFSFKEENDKIIAECDLSLFDKKGGTREIYAKLANLFESYYIENNEKSFLTEYEKKEMSIFAYEHNDLFLNRYNKSGIKLYYNFCCPPFKKVVSKAEMDSFVKPFELRLKRFLKTFQNEDCDILAFGGGFEQLWAKSAARETLGDYNAVGAAACIIACGACIIACRELGIVKGLKIEIYDKQQIKEEIGIIVGEDKFISLCEKNTFWWQEQKKKYFIIDDSGDEDYRLEIFKNTKSGLVRVSVLNLDGLRKNGKKTVRLAMQIIYESCEKAKIQIKDIGFGEIEKSTGFDKSFAIP